MDDSKGWPESPAFSPENRETIHTVLAEINALRIEDEVARVLRSHSAGKMVRQLVYWEGRGMCADFWIFKSGTEWWDEAGLTRSNLKTATAKLEGVGLLEVDRNRIRPTDQRPCTFYRLDLWAVLRLVDPATARDLEPELIPLEEEVVTESNQPSTPLNQSVETSHTSTSDYDDLTCEFLADEPAGTSHTNVTETVVPQQSTSRDNASKPSTDFSHTPPLQVGDGVISGEISTVREGGKPVSLKDSPELQELREVVEAARRQNPQITEEGLLKIITSTLISHRPTAIRYLHAVLEDDDLDQHPAECLCDACVYNEPFF